ncbi:hypothetical protein BGW38_003626 [Lunasporangiospora selenospora]|uniref:beta-glucosidase n=1 Tax=Lunasporangiospora selenospora TaxID=979761 RepID=A0A9P6G422_9FUNG|nr:hypothetical protein BGW38_003626 [Lunasporangiospora selenospora]
METVPYCTRHPPRLATSLFLLVTLFAFSFTLFAFANPEQDNYAKAPAGSQSRHHHHSQNTRPKDPDVDTSIDPDQISKLLLAKAPGSESLESSQPVFSAQNSAGDPDYNPQQTSTDMEQILDINDDVSPVDSYPLPESVLDSSGFDNSKDPGNDDDQKDKDTEKEKPDDTQSGKIDDDILQLTESLTLKELVGQMTQIQIGMLIDSKGELDPEKIKYWVKEWGVGSFLDTPTNHGGKYISYSAKRFAKVVDTIQKVAMSTDKRIPMIYGLDSVHGANYVDGAVLFPQEIGLAATFNTTIAYESGRITAKDTRAAGIPWVFAPILDIAVHKLWPRVYETFGEDPHVATAMGSAVIQGLQGNYKKDRTRVAACMKHFIGYSASRNGQDKSSAWIPDNHLMDYFVPPFQAAVDVGVATAMETYIDVNGQPVVGSRFYLTELLRHRMGFEGMLVTDWAELDRLYTEHRSVPSLKDAALQCLKRTSVDMVMVPESESFSKNTLELIDEERLDRNRLVESVSKILQLKKDLGLFDKPFSDPDLLPLVGSAQDVDMAREAIRESVTVLKNKDSTLPLWKSDTGRQIPPKLFLTGPTSDSIRALSGGWSIKWQGAEKDEWYQGRGQTILNGFLEHFPSELVTHVPSVDFDGNLVSSKEQYLQAAQAADIAIVCLGEKPYAEIVGNIENPDLPRGQLDVVRDLAKRLQGSRTRIVLVLVEGRPRGLQEVHGLADAIVMAYLPGPWGGGPIAEVIAGGVNPSGRLPMTYPSNVYDLATTYYRSGIDPYKPLFAFGAGLSYSEVEYSNLQLSESSIHLAIVSDNDEGDDDDSVDANQSTSTANRLFKSTSSRKLDRHRHHSVASVTIKNKSQRHVKETVFWYITQDYRREVSPEAFLLKGFQKILIAPGQSETVVFRIGKDMLAFHNRHLKKKVERGSFTLTVNAMRPEALSAKFQVM